MHDADLIQRCKNAYDKYRKGSVIDLDKGSAVKCRCQVHRLEILMKEFNGFVPPNRRTEFMISFLKKGTGKRTIGCYEFPLKKNTLSIVPSRSIMSSTYDSLNLRGYVLMFSLDFFVLNGFPYQLVVGKKALKPSVRPFVALTMKQAKKLEEIFEDLLEENENISPLREEMLAIKILALLILCERYFSADYEKTAYSILMERFASDIERHFTKNRSVQFYSSLLNVHPNYLNYHVKKQTGLTAKQTIDNRIILEAKYMLFSTDMTVKEIAYELGFEDPNYFTSFFTKAEQLSPAQFRIDGLENKRR